MVKSLVSKLSTASNLSLVASSLVGSGGSVSKNSDGGVQETNYLKHRNDPGRFFGDGVQFKAKLIGILEVGEARGDRMCQEALQDLKMAIRAAGEHKQRITIHVTIEGLRLRDEKTGDSLYHHPVHKISFIAQDMTDSRAFGYIFGSPDSGHRFFGIKTDKAASQVVLAMRDLFQVVFELKKKEIELARQQIQTKSLHHEHQSQLASLSSLKSAVTASASVGGGHVDLNSGANTMEMLSRLSGGGGGAGSSNASTRLGGGGGVGHLDVKGGLAKELSPESVADLVDLEQELSSIQRGITQMERITPNDGGGASTSHAAAGAIASGANKMLASSGEDDPFGDSFTNFSNYNILPPPPESGRTRNKPVNKTPDGSGQISTLLSPVLATSSSPATLQAAADDEDSWLHELDQQNDVFDTSKATTAATMSMGGGVGVMSVMNNSSGGSVIAPIAPMAPSEAITTPTQQTSDPSALLADNELSGLGLSSNLNEMAASATLEASKSDAFTDLDPLGTGRTRPYVDKKYFFQELKNPPKKVLKDLTTNNATHISTGGSSSGGGAASLSGLLSTEANHYVTTAAAAATSSSSVDEFLSKEPPIFTDPGIVSGSGLVNEHPHIITLTNIINANAAQSLGPNGTDPVLRSTLNAGKVSPTHAECVADPGDPVLLPRDTDPFSPTRKKSDPDPFQEGDLFSKLDAFEFEFGASSDNNRKEKIQTSNVGTSTNPNDSTISGGVFNGPLQVQLPPESGVTPPSSVTELSSSSHWKNEMSRLERQMSECGGSSNSARSRPTTGVGQSNAIATSNVGMGIGGAPTASVFKQQTVDVISSISNKKMPHLFGQARFSKRDSNYTVNMRRLQESDSLSETEMAPEPPPRPDSTPYSEPPPLPPKKQFNDIVIRPHSAIPSPAAGMSSGSRYEYLNKTSTTSGGGVLRGSNQSNVPPIPLPSRRVARSEGYFPGPSRPRKPGHTEDDYLAPVGNSTSSNSGGISIVVGSNVANGKDVPPLLPPPTSNRAARTQRQQSVTQKSQEIYENKVEIMLAQNASSVVSSDVGGQGSLAPDITLSQLLTLGIDELAMKLNVPASKLSTMTLVELTAYISEYLTGDLKPSKPMPPIPKNSSPVPPIQSSSEASSIAAPAKQAVFKVNFDHHTSFVAKFDDTFGEDLAPTEAFIANFANFNEAPTAASSGSATNKNQVPIVPSADRYAVFREIIDQELQEQQQNTNLMGDLTPPPAESDNDEAVVNNEQRRDGGDDLLESPEQQQHQPLPKIDTKITEVVAQAKDRYAALRDIILVENLFDKPKLTGTTNTTQEKDLMQMQDFTEFSDEFNEDQDLKQIMDDRLNNTTAPDRHGLVDSRGLPAEPSSSALTVDDDDDDDDDDEEEEDAGAESSLDSNDKDTEPGEAQLLQDQYEKLSTSTQQLDAPEKTEIKVETPTTKGDDIAIKQDNKFLTVNNNAGGVAGCGMSGSKDDLEIDELMQRAISNLSLDSRERTSPASATAGLTPRPGDPTQQHRHPSTGNSQNLNVQTHFNDVSTSPIPQQQQQKSPQAQVPRILPQSKSAQVSPVPLQLSAVSQLIDVASKQMMHDAAGDPTAAKSSKESWATFDSPKAESNFSHESRRNQNRQPMKSSSASTTNATQRATSLHLPPPPPSNTSQQDTAESPCSSDPRDDGGGWSKNISGRRGWHKKERQHTSSSSRDLSPWDDETPDSYAKQQRRIPAGIMAGGPPLQLPGGVSTDRHGYYMRHARRMNSCDEDYDYEEECNSRRVEQRKFKQGISRSRDNFDLDSPSWYHHPVHTHTWSPQDFDQSSGVRGRSFERSAYERSTYGPPIYDKRGNPLPAPGSSSYDRRSAAAYDKRGKYYRDYVRPNYDYADDYGIASPMQGYRGGTGNMEGMKGRRTTDYENVYDDRRSPLGYKTQRSEYVYERDRKSFDRESVESFESSTRRRRSFGSGGDVYGSLDSRDEYRGDRYLSGSNMDLKTRSLRKPTKLRVTGDIDYEQDSEHDYQQQQQQHSRNTVGRSIEARSLQRPSQLSEVNTSGGVVGQTRLRKSSGSSPWDGEEPSIPGQKSWKRPSSATETERRLAESRRAAAMAQTPSDNEKDRRFRKKSRTRAGKEQLSSSGGGSAPRYSSAPIGGSSRAALRDNYDYIACQDDEDIDDDEDYVDDEEYEEEPPTDEDKFERLNRRRHEMHQRMLESERRQKHGGGGGSGFCKMGPPPPLSMLKSSTDGSKRYGGPTNMRGTATDYGFVDSYEQSPTPRSNASSSAAMTSSAGLGDNSISGGSKFNFDDGFESDFNQCGSPTAAQACSVSSYNSTPAASVPSSAGIGASSGAVNSTSSMASKSLFRFSNDFSERDKLQQQQQHQQQLQQQQFGESLDGLNVSGVGGTTVPTVTPPITTQKLRFDDNVKVSQFDDAAFEDDFAKASFDFDKEDVVVHHQQHQQQQWQNQPQHLDQQRSNNGGGGGGGGGTNIATLPASAFSKKQNLRSSKLQQRQELIKKSESVNIFAKKVEDPFEDDEFFKSPCELDTASAGSNVDGCDNGDGADSVDVSNNGTTTKNQSSCGGTTVSGAGAPSGGAGSSNNFQWENESNFAKFDENM